MSTNVTVMITLTDEPTYPQLLSEELAEKICQVFQFVLFPCTSVLGIIGNVASMVILTRHGFRKSSNILLMALAASDVLFLIGLNNITMYIYIQNVPQGFRYSETINYILYIIVMVFFCTHTIGLQSAMIIPVLITGERILAIFCPLKVYFILTPRRTMIVIALIYILNWLYFLYDYVLKYKFKTFIFEDPMVGVFLYTKMYENDIRSGVYLLVKSLVNYMTGVVPVCLVAVGCLVIGTQVALITNRRKQLTSSQVKQTTKKATSRTTKTLFSVCFLYVLCSGFGFVIVYVARIESLNQDMPFQLVIEAVRDYLLCVNCIGDFVIYVGANKHFTTAKPSKKNIRHFNN